MPENNNIHKTDLEKVMEHFPAPKRAEIRDVWEKSGTVRTETSDISSDDIESALENVHQRMDSDGVSQSSPKKQKWLFLYSKYLVAAIALLVFGIGYLLVPASYTVPYSETATVELPDGSTAELNSGSTIQYNRLFSLTGRSVTLNGEAYFTVEPGSDPYTIEANGSVTEVLGTEFNLRSWNTDPNQKSELAVTNGMVRFYPKNNSDRSIELIAGEKAIWDLEMDQPKTVDASDPDSFTAWREQRMVFMDSPLIVILHELERRFDVEIELEAQNMQMEPLTAYYTSPTGVESILEDICTVKGLRFSETANGYRIFK